MVATKLLPVETSSKVAADPLASGDSQVTLSHVECSHQALAYDSAGPLVALQVSLNWSCSSRLPRVSTVPLTITSLEHRTTLQASRWRHATKPSRRWQPPRVTSATGLQLDHLVPNSCNLSVQRTRRLSLNKYD